MQNSFCYWTRRLKPAWFSVVAIMAVLGLEWNNQGATTPSSPVETSITALADLPVVTVVANDPWAAEQDQDPGVFTISRSGNSGASLTVFYSLTGTATSGDYLSLPGTLTIPSGASSATVQVVPRDGPTPEPNETVILNLLARDLYRVGYPSNAVVTIKDNDSPTNSSATLTITNPTNGATFIAPATIKIEVTAIDPAGYISKVDFYANSNKIGESQIWFIRAPDPGTPIYHSFVWTNAPGTSMAEREQVLTARAVDSHNLAVVSKPALVTFTNLSKPPIITLSSPTNGSSFTYPSSILLSAHATDPEDGGVSFVEFYEGTNRLARLTNHWMGLILPGQTNLPYSVDFQFVWTNPPPGQYRLMARAIDSKGVSADTSPAYITVITASYLPTVRIEASTPSVREGSTNTGEFTITRDDRTNNALVVMCSIGGTASNGVDYVALPTSISLPAGVRSTSVIVRPLDDSLVEGNETVTLTLLPDPSMYPIPRYLVGLPYNAVVTIIDSVRAQRFLPSNAATGRRFTVRIQVTPLSSTSVYAVEDQPPAGWVASSISNDGVFDTVTGKVKFGPFFDSTARTLTYDVTPSAGASGTQQFAGLYSADGISQQILGASAISLISPYHPADRNPTNYVLTITELTAYGSAWKHGAQWPVGPNPIPITYVTRAGALWKGGESYRFEPNAEPPNCWVSANSSILPASVMGMNAMARPMGMNEGTAVSALATHFVPGVPFTVTLTVTPAADTTVYAVEDQPPAGWPVSLINEGGVYDSVNQKVKWVFLDKIPRTLTYQVTPMDCAPDTRLTFNGTASFDSLQGGLTMAIVGLRSTGFNPGNGPRITGVARQSATEVLLTIQGVPGQLHAVQTTPDLQKWTTLAELTPTEIQYQFRDTNAVADHRFYRVILKAR